MHPVQTIHQNEAMTHLHCHMVQQCLSLVGLLVEVHWVWSFTANVYLLMFQEHIIQENRFELGVLAAKSTVSCITDHR